MENQSEIHTTKNTHVVIPKKSLWSLAGFVASAVFTYFQAVWYLIPGFYEIRDLKTLISSNGLLWVPIISYVLMALNVYLLVNIHPKKVKEWNEKGLIKKLILGFILGIIFGIVLIIILIISTVINERKIFIDPMISKSSILILTYMLLLGYVLGLINGLIDEFKK